VLPWLDEENKVTRDQLTRSFQGEIISPPHPEPSARMDSFTFYTFDYKPVTAYYNENTSIGELIKTIEEANHVTGIEIIDRGRSYTAKDLAIKASQIAGSLGTTIFIKMPPAPLAAVVVVRSPEQIQMLKDQLGLDSLPFEVQVEDAEAEEPEPIPVTNFNSFYLEFEVSKARVGEASFSRQ